MYNLISKKRNFKKQKNVLVLHPSIEKRILEPSLKYLKTTKFKQEGLCAEAIIFCELNVNIGHNSETIISAQIIPDSGREEFGFGQIISPVMLAKKNLDDSISTILENNINFNYLGENPNEDIKFQQKLSEIILSIIPIIRCDVMKINTMETIFRFYLFSLNESGYPKFIIESKTRKTTFNYISSELLPIPDIASSSSPFEEEEESEEELKEVLEEELEEESEK